MPRHTRIASLVSLLAAVSLLATGCGDDGSVLGLSTTVPATDVTATSEATPSTGTTGPSATTTTAMTVPVATTTTLPPTTTTTTVPGTLGPPPVAMEFLPDGLGIVDFGATPNDVVAAVRDYLGFNKTDDSGWGPAWGDFGACPGTEYRQVRFGGLVLGFSDVDRFRPAGIRQFISWAYDGDPAVDVPFGVDVGMTVADLQGLYPTVSLLYDDTVYGDVFRFEGPAPGEQLWGTLTGPDAGDTIEYLTGGWGCGE